MHIRQYLVIACVLLFTFALSGISFATWTPLIDATDFAGIRTDVLTTAAGIVSILLVIAGIGLLVRAFSR